jgi:hypothetical protein
MAAHGPGAGWEYPLRMVQLLLEHDLHMARDGNGQGRVRVKHLPTRWHTRLSLSYPYPPNVTGTNPYPYPLLTVNFRQPRVLVIHWFRL